MSQEWLPLRIFHYKIEQSQGYWMLGYLTIMLTRLLVILSFKQNQKLKQMQEWWLFFAHKIAEIRMVAIKHVSLQDGDIARLFNVGYLTRMLTVFMLNKSDNLCHKIEKSQDLTPILSTFLWNNLH